MPYQFPLDPRDVFGERYPQMVSTGMPAVDIDSVRGAVVEMWSDRPGGWVYEWSELGARFAAEGQHDLAVLAYGWAKFPVLADEAKHLAFRRQLEEYQLGSLDFPVSFERRVLELPYQDRFTRVPVHILSATDLAPEAPIVLVSGGVDTWKMDLHTLLVDLALETGARVIAFDIPGTGESEVPLGGAAISIIEGLLAAGRNLGNGQIVHLWHLDGRLPRRLYRADGPRRRSSGAWRAGRSGVLP